MELLNKLLKARDILVARLEVWEELEGNLSETGIEAELSVIAAGEVVSGYIADLFRLHPELAVGCYYRQEIRRGHKLLGYNSATWFVAVKGASALTPLEALLLRVAPARASEYRTLVDQRLPLLLEKLAQLAPSPAPASA